MLHRVDPGEVLAEALAQVLAYHCNAAAARASEVRVLRLASFRARLAVDLVLVDAWTAHLARVMQTARTRPEVRTPRTVRDWLDAWLATGGVLPPRGATQEPAAELDVSREALHREQARRGIAGSALHSLGSL